jgi:hypothetical protein
MFTWSTPTSVLSAAGLGQGGLSDVSCPSTTLCVASVVGATTQDESQDNDVVVFNPQNPATTAVAQMLFTPDSGFDDDAIQGLSCPTTSQCTLDGTSPDAVTFDPSDLTQEATSQTISNQSDVASLGPVLCPSTSQCISESDNAPTALLTFDPDGSAGPSAGASAPGMNGFKDAIACATAAPDTSSNACVAIAGGQLEPFSPGSSPGSAAGPSSTEGVACASTSECVAVGYDSGTGDSFEFAFSPTAIGSPTPQTIDTTSGEIPSLLACPSTSQCTGSSVDGTSITFDPSDPADEVKQQPDRAGDVEQIACPSVSECVLVDDTGHVVFGTAAPAPVPTLISPPVITGQAVVGQTLTTSHGSWANAPSSYAYEWERCLKSGSDCVAIAGKTGSVYTPTSTDVGYAIRVGVTASNTNGPSAEVFATRTAGVTAATQLPTKQQIEDALAGALSNNANTSLGSPSTTINSPSPGQSTVGWEYFPESAWGDLAGKRHKAKAVLLAHAKVTIRHKGRVKIKLHLTSAGRRLLKHFKRTKVTATMTFKPRGSKKTYSAKRTFPVRR